MDVWDRPVKQRDRYRPLNLFLGEGSLKAESGVNKTDPTSHEGRGPPKATDTMEPVRERKGMSEVEGGGREIE